MLAHAVTLVSGKAVRTTRMHCHTNSMEISENAQTTSLATEDRHVFTGRIHPERYDWHIEPQTGLNILLDEERLHVTLSVMRSQLVIAVTGRYVGNLLDLKNILADFTQVTVDAVSFVAAAALDVEIISCLDPAGNVHVFNTGFDGLRSHDGELVAEEMDHFRLLRGAGYQNLAVRAALSDLSQAIKIPGGTLFYCYRAIESIRQQYLAPGASDDRKAREASWSALRTASHLEEAETRWLARGAAPRRHGSVSSISEPERRRALLQARKVVLAYARSLVDGSTS